MFICEIASHDPTGHECLCWPEFGQSWAIVMDPFKHMLPHEFHCGFNWLQIEVILQENNARFLNRFESWTLTPRHAGFSRASSDWTPLVARAGRSISQEGYRILSQHRSWFLAINFWKTAQLAYLYGRREGLSAYQDWNWAALIPCHHLHNCHSK